MYENLVFVGRLGADPESRFTPAGDQVTNFSVAVNTHWTDKAGEPRDRVSWYRVACWGRLAEVCNQYLLKGRMVMVTAKRIEAEAYLSKNGQPKAALKVTADTVKFLDSVGTEHDKEAGEMPF